MIIFWHGYLLIFIKLRHKGGVTATACFNYRAPVLPRYVDFSGGENRSTRRKTLKALERP